MKSPNDLKISLSMPSKQIPISTSVAYSPTKQKNVRNTDCYIGSDGRLQSTDKRRSYMRRGSKTPSMMLINATLDIGLLGKSLLSSDFKIDEHEFDFSNNGNVHTFKKNAITTHTALAMATAIDVLDDSYLAELRKKRRSNTYINDDSSWPDDKPPNVVPDVYTLDENDCEELHTFQYSNKLMQPRRLSTMSALKQHLEKTSISHAPSNVTCTMKTQR
jgi:hypothetical protein